MAPLEGDPPQGPDAPLRDRGAALGVLSPQPQTA
jgi:hypothetical protein